MSAQILISDDLPKAVHNIKVAYQELLSAIDTKDNDKTIQARLKFQLVFGELRTLSNEISNIDLRE